MDMCPRGPRERIATPLMIVSSNLTMFSSLKSLQKRARVVYRASLLRNAVLTRHVGSTPTASAKILEKLWKCDRVVYRAALEKQRLCNAVRGFESHHFLQLSINGLAVKDAGRKPEIKGSNPF